MNFRKKYKMVFVVEPTTKQTSKNEWDKMKFNSTKCLLVFKIELDIKKIIFNFMNLQVIDEVIFFQA